MKITIIGLGGVGGYFGFKLADAFKKSIDVQVNFIARETTYNVVKEHGLTLISPEHLHPVAYPEGLFQKIADAPVADLWVVCVKEYDLENICLQLRDKIKPGAVILPLMNGVDIYDRIRKLIPDGVVLPACVYVASHIKEKGIVEHKGAAGRIILGRDPEHLPYDPSEIVALLKQAGIDILYKEDALVDIWTKFFFIASFGLVSARYNKPIGVVNEDAELHSRANRIMEELKLIADQKGIAVPQDIIELTFKKAATFPYTTPTSLQLDVQSGKVDTELELFAGAIISYGNLLDIPVVETSRIYDEIKAGLLS